MYVVYDLETTLILNNPKKWGITKYETERSARAARTRAGDREGKKYGVAEWTEFLQHIEHKEIRHGIVGSAGKEFLVGVNEPWTSGPWSETYWCS